MKKSLDQIYNLYPNVAKKMKKEDVVLTNVEDVFYQLALFANDPDTYSFNLTLIYKNLTDDHLVFALETIIEFFQKDTYLIKDKKVSFIRNTDETEELYNQTMFAKYLSENGLTSYSPRSINVYYERGKLPKADKIINKKPHWYESTVELFLENKKSDSRKKK